MAATATTRTVQFNDLAAGETATDSFTYTADDDSAGATDTATVTVTINGANDGPGGRCRRHRLGR